MLSKDAIKGIAHNTQGRQVMLEQTLPIATNPIYEASADRPSLTVFAAVALLRKTSFFVYTHPSRLKPRLEREEFLSSPFITEVEGARSHSLGCWPG